MSSSEGLLADITRSTRFVGLGLIGLGILSALLPALTGAPVMILVGTLLVLVGVVRGWFGWRAWSEGKGLRGVVSGGLAAVCGLVIVMNPVSTLATVSSVVAAYMVLDGISEVVLSGRLRPEDGRAWAWGDAIFSILLGVSMWIGWPLSGVRALGLLLGAKLVAAGVVVLRVERGMRRLGARAAGLRARLDGSDWDDPPRDEPT